MRQKKKKITKKRLKAKRNAASKLTVSEKSELKRAARKGFVTLDGRAQGHRPLSTLCSSEALKASRAATAHREWCDKRKKPNIILYKASGHNSSGLDHVVVDLSPLRMSALFEGDEEIDLACKWKTEILGAAASAGMVLQTIQDTVECSTDIIDEEDAAKEFTIRADGFYNAQEGCLDQPISKLPIVSMGFFVGDRTNAKAMARELATIWDIPKIEEAFEVEKASAKAGKNAHKKVTPHSQERKRRRQRDDLEALLNRYS
jgi:hypothetical protein